MRCLGLVVAASCAATPQPATSTKPVDRTIHVAFEPRIFHLRNGLTVMLVPDRDLLASALTVVHAGAIDDPTPGVARVATYTSYAPMEDERTRWDQLSRSAVSIDGRPDTVETQFSTRFDPTHLADVLHVEAARLSVHCDDRTEPYFTRQRALVAAELQHLDSWTLNREFRHATYPAGDPRATVYDATPASVASITYAQMCAFEDRYYVPANATIAVSGNFDPASFEKAIDAAFGGLASGAPNARATGAPLAVGTDEAIVADVEKPATAVSFPISANPLEHERTMFAIKLAATVLPAAKLAFGDETATLWFSDDLDGAAKVKAIVVDAKDFETTRMRRATELLGRLDDTESRLFAVAEHPTLDAPFAALARVTPADVTARLALANARVLRISPSGSRWRPTYLGDPGHNFRGPSMYRDEPPMPIETVSNALAGARTLVLPNGMTVVLAPTSLVPLVHISLGFAVGSADEPADRPGTAAIAIGAVEQSLLRGRPASRWVTGVHSHVIDFDESAVILRGPTVDLDLLLARFAALAEPRITADQQPTRDEIARTPPSAEMLKHRQIAVSLFGADHPYGRTAPPSASVPAEVVEAFARRYLQPDNATMVITGGFDPEAVEPLVRAAFAGWRGTGERPAKRPAHTTATSFAFEDQNAGVTMSFNWRADDDETGDEARMILASELGGITPSAWARFSRHRSAGTYFLTSHLDGPNYEDAAARLIVAITKVGGGSPDDVQTFERRRRRAVKLLGDFATSSSAWANGVLGPLLAGHDLAWIAGRQRRAAATTNVDIARLVQRELIAPSSMGIVVSGPREVVTAIYAALGIAPTWL